MLTSIVKGDLVEALVDGEVDEAGFTALRPRLEEAAQRHGAVRVLVEVRRLTGVAPRALLEDLRSAGLLGILTRYAVVTSSAPLRVAAGGAPALLPVEGRVFEDRDEALERLRS